jgi:hypothetical protein
VRHLFLVIVLFGAGLRPANAADAPAQMVIGEDSIEERLLIPRKLEPGRYEIQCEAVIGVNGSARNVVCYSFTDFPAPRRLQFSARHATRISRFIPARRNGAPIEVYALLMVIVDTRLDEPLILAVPNNGAEKARYGLLYTAPQRYGRVVVSRPRLQLRMPHRPVVWMNLQIDELGIVRHYTLTDQAEPEQGWVDTIAEFVRQLTFLPGYHEGKPVPMLYTEPVLGK